MLQVCLSYLQNWIKEKWFNNNGAKINYYDSQELTVNHYQEFDSITEWINSGNDTFW